MHAHTHIHTRAMCKLIMKIEFSNPHPQPHLHARTHLVTHTDTHTYTHARTLYSHHMQHAHTLPCRQARTHLIICMVHESTPQQVERHEHARAHLKRQQWQ
jgi:hypothetical protein